MKGEQSTEEQLTRQLEALKQTTDELKASEERYDALYTSMAEGVCFHEIVFDDLGQPIDYRIMDVNPAYESILGIEREVAVGSLASELYGTGEPPYIDIYAKVAATGEPTSFETYFQPMDKAFRISAFSPGPGKFATVFNDITKEMRSELQLQDTLQMLRKALGGTISTLTLIVEKREPRTAGHQQRVANLSRAIAGEIGLESEKIDGIRIAGSIHDLGKIFIPADVLVKPSTLTSLEFDLIKTHPRVGYDILKTVEFPWPVAQIVFQHHERWNGSGYPQGLQGENILPEARVLAVADVVEAMTSHRPYRPARSVDEALEEISQNRGTLYDSSAVDACLILFMKKGFEL